MNLATAQEEVTANSAVLRVADVAVGEATMRPTEVHAVGLKLPALWPDNPVKWFLHCEAKFRLHKITVQQTMFDHCVNAMTADQSDVVMDLMMTTPPSANCYDELLSKYLKRRSPSTAEGVQRLRAIGYLLLRAPSASSMPNRKTHHSTPHRQVAMLTESNDRIVAELAQLSRKTRRSATSTRSGSGTANSEHRRPKMYRGLHDECICWYHAAWGAEAAVVGTRGTAARVASGE